MKPLEGYRVLDFTANMAGPYATLILAEQGADVIKIEPLEGDVMRRVGSGRPGMSALFANLNRGKRSIAIDLASEAGIGLVQQLAERADVVVQSFRPGVAERMGIGVGDLRRRAPQLVYVSISGYGRTGPLAGEPAYDHVLQALTGMASIQEPAEGGRPQLVRHGIVDKTTGMAVAQAVTGALLRREREGVGSEIEVSMLDAALHYFWPDGMMNDTCLDEIVVHPPVSRTFRLTPTADGDIAVVTVTDKQWRSMLTALDLDGELEAGAGVDMDLRRKVGGQMMRRAAARMAAMSTDQVVTALRAHDVPCMPVVATSEVARHEQVVAAGTILEEQHPQLGRMLHPRPPQRVAHVDERPTRPAPTLGADTVALLGEHGFDHPTIEELVRRSVVA